MKLQNLKPAEGSTQTNRRLGRGQGSGFGTQAGRGHKGQKSRRGYSQKKGFEGGQMPLQRRVPKFGFKNFNRVEYKAINLDAIQELFDKTKGGVIDLGVLQANGLISKTDKVKVLGRGELNAAIEIRVNAFSASAIVAIEKAGGKAIVDSTVSGANVVEVSKSKSSFKDKTPVQAPAAKSLSAEVKPAKSLAKVEVVSDVTVEEKASVESTKEIEAPKAKATKVTKGDDLKLIEGIGPKIADLFISAGIDTFAKLADCSVDQMKEILATGGSRYSVHDPSTWAQQSELARDGKMDELKELQDRLNAGKE